ncbi:MAG: tripartite tricarboxylate transporter permease [Methanobacteriota archaeon]|nr:MAG: tripartite tricarboxylate transporter permease [Euryarchaeota archaeon]
MATDQTIVTVLLSSVAGTGVGFCTGLVPGLHVNNLAAIAVASSASVVGMSCCIGSLFGCGEAALLVACFLVAAMMAHMFSESIVATYLGIPSGDNVSLLPAHRLAKEGMGQSAVRTSADGSLAGAVLGLLFMLPVCALLGPPIDAYSPLRSAMGIAVLLLSVLLVASDGIGRRAAVGRILRGAAFFLISGTIGFVVLDTNYFAASVPDFPWMRAEFVPKSSLLLPLFAGLFGIPTLLHSIAPGHHAEAPLACFMEIRTEPQNVSPDIRLKEVLTSCVGGVLVGWIPGVTSGSSATLCASAIKGSAPEGGEPEEAARFIWLYSAISSCGAVLSVGALFAIARARSGIMQAVVFFMGDSALEVRDLGAIDSVCALLMSMLAAALLSHMAIHRISGTLLLRLQNLLCSRKAAVLSFVFVSSLVLALTGTRGGLLLLACAALGLLPPMCGSRRINLMGCLLLPICIAFLLD